MKFIISCLLGLALTNAYTQNTLQGIVTDSDSNTGIAFANIYFPQLEKGAATDENGRFKIDDLPNGTYRIVCSIIGYGTFSQGIDLPYEGDLDIQLSATAIEMEGVVVSTPFHKLQSDNVMKVERLTLESLKGKGQTTLAEGITNIPGASSVTTGLSIGKPVIRGLSGNRVLVYTQGIRLENQQFGDEHGLGINASGLESIEVIKGPASLLYGSDALGGVLYLNPEKFAAQNETHGDLNVDYFTNTQGLNTNLGFKTSGKNLKFILRGGLSEHSDYDTEDYRVTNSRFKEQDLKTALGYQSTRFKTELRYNFNGSELGIPEELGEQSTDKDPLLPFQEIDNHILSSKSSVFFSNSSMDVNLGYIFNDRKEFAEELDEAELHMKLKTFNYDLKYNLPELGKLETIVGIQGMHQTNANFGEEELIPDATTNDFGILAHSHIHFEAVDLHMGLRFDNRNISVDNGIDRSFNSFNGAFGLKFDMFKTIATRINLATGFRAPNLAELTSDGVHEGTNRYEIGNPDLDNEQNFQLDFALEFRNEHFEVSAGAFYNRINDYIFISPDGSFIDGDPVYNYLQDDAKLYGGEFGLHLHPHPLDWLHFESSFETVTGAQDNEDPLPLIPANTLSNTLRFDLKEGWLKQGYAFMTLRSTFAQDDVSQFETRTGGYSLLSAGLGGNMSLLKHDLQLSISVTNLFNKAYISHLSRLKPDGIFNMGRNFSFGFSYSL